MSPEKTTFAIKNEREMKAKGYLMAALAAASYGTNPLFAIHLYENGMNANSVLFFRYVLGLPLLALMLIARGHSLRLRASEFGSVAILGILMAFSSLTLFEAYNYMNAGIASTLLFVYPVMVALMMIIIFHEEFHPSIGLCLLIMAGGLILLMRGDVSGNISIFGVTLVILSSLTYAVYLVMVNVSKTISRIPTLKLLFYVLLTGCSVFIFMIPMGSPLILPSSAADWGNVCALAIIPTIFSLTCTTVAIKNVGSTVTAIFGALEPVTALAISIFALGQPVTGKELGGAVLILIATTMVVASSRIDTVLLRVRKMFPRRRSRH